MAAEDASPRGIRLSRGQHHTSSGTKKEARNHLELVAILQVKRVSSNEISRRHIAHGDSAGLEFSHFDENKLWTRMIEKNGHGFVRVCMEEAERVSHES